MLDRVLRPVKDRLFTPAAERIGVSFSPNALTLLSFVVGLAAAALLLVQSFGWALVVWLGSRVLDGMDGAVARAHGRQTDFGGYLDIVLDFVVYAAMPIALIAGRGAGPGEYLALAALLGAFYVNAASWMYLSAILEKRAQGAAARGEPTSVTMPEGVIGGSETIVFFALFMLLPHHAAPMFLLMALLLAVTVVQRLIWSARTL